MLSKTLKIFGLTLVGAHCVAGSARADQCLFGPADITELPGAPEWQDFDADGFWRPELHDPRWSGSTAEPLAFLPGGASPILDTPFSVRTLVVGRVLYVAAYVDTDDQPTLSDSFQIGFTDGASNTAHAFKIEMGCGGTVINAPALPPGFSVSPFDVDKPRVLAASDVKHWSTTNRNDPTSWVADTASPPTWFQGACWNRVITGGPRWGVTLRIERGATTEGQDRNLFFGVARSMTSGGSSARAVTKLGNVAPPANAADGIGGTMLVPKDVSTWERFTPNVESDTSPCRNGLTLARTDLGVWSGAPGGSDGSIGETICAGGDCGPGDNVLRIRARRATKKYDDWDVRARFRISDWGSNADTREFGSWQDIWVVGTNRPDPFKATKQQLTTDGRWFWKSTNTTVTIDYNCTKGTDPYCPKLQNSDANRQVLLVNLALMGTSEGQTVRNSWTLRNMQYRNLSEATEKAVISVAGLEPTPDGKPREVYLQVVPVNLTPHRKEPVWLPTEAMRFAEEVVSNPFVVERKVPEPPKYEPESVLDANPTPNQKPQAPVQKAGAEAPKPGQDPKQQSPYDKPEKPEPKKPERKLKLPKQPPPKVSPYTREDYIREQAVAAAPYKAFVRRVARDDKQLIEGKFRNHEALAMSEDQLLDATYPSYRVIPYYVTGREKAADGTEQLELAPMPSFGLRFKHDKNLYGFSHHLYKSADGKAGEVDRVAGTTDWYHVFIPNEGKAEVYIHVKAEEVPLEEPPAAIMPCPPAHTPVHGCGACAVNSDGSATWLSLGGLFVLGLGLGGRRLRRRSSATAVD